MEKIAKNKSVLIVDDDPESLVSFSRIFQNAGFEVETADCAKDALNILQNGKLDLALIDVILPDMMGTDLCISIKNDPKLIDIIIILISGRKISEDDYLFGLEIGAGDYLKRPISAKELLARVNSLFRLKDSFAKPGENNNNPFNFRNTEQTAAVFDQKSIKEAYSKEFGEFVKQYSAILNDALESRFYKTSNSASEKVIELSAELGFMKASARDVIELHKTALSNSVESKSAKRAFYIKEESRVLLIELMGYLLNFYRNKY